MSTGILKVQDKALNELNQTVVLRGVAIAKLFRGMDEDGLEALARGFHFDECIQRKELNEILERHAHVNRDLAVSSFCQ